MSQRGYGEPPYQREDGTSRRRPADARDRLRQTTSQPPADALDDRDRAPRPRPASTRRPPDAADDRYAGSGSRSRWSSETYRRGRRTPSARPESYPPRESPYPADDPRQYPPVYDEQSQYDDRWDQQQDSAEWADDDAASMFDEAAPAAPGRHQSRLGQRMRSSRGRAAARPSARPSVPPLRVPATFTRLDLLQDQVALALLGVALVSTLVMTGIVAGRLGSLPDVIALRFDAAGDPKSFGPPSNLWQLPLLAAMVTIMNAVLAGWVSRFDRFASRFVLAAAAVVGLLAWIPLVRFLW